MRKIIFSLLLVIGVVDVKGLDFLASRIKAASLTEEMSVPLCERKMNVALEAALAQANNDTEVRYKNAAKLFLVKFFPILTAERGEFWQLRSEIANATKDFSPQDCDDDYDSLINLFCSISEEMYKVTQEIRWLDIQTKNIDFFASIAIPYKCGQYHDAVYSALNLGNGYYSITLRKRGKLPTLESCIKIEEGSEEEKEEQKRLAVELAKVRSKVFLKKFFPIILERDPSLSIFRRKVEEMIRKFKYPASYMDLEDIDSI